MHKVIPRIAIHTAPVSTHTCVLSLHHAYSTACDERYVSLALSPGTVITLGGVHIFRFNHPAEAAVLRERRRVGAENELDAAD